MTDKAPTAIHSGHSSDGLHDLPMEAHSVALMALTEGVGCVSDCVVQRERPVAHRPRNSVHVVFSRLTSLEC